MSKFPPISKEGIDLTRLPRHVAIIMDGNGRWATKHRLPRAKGHDAGAQSVRAVIEGCRELAGIGALSLFAFSTENWKRSRTEINTLFRLLSKHIRAEIDGLHEQGIRVVFTGRREGLSAKTLTDMEASEALTRANRAMTLNVCINYGARTELVDAARAIVEDVRTGRIGVSEIDEKQIAAHLYLPDFPEVDLLIRTSGEMRLSNFMLWQCSYAEIVVCDTLWPDFRKADLREALIEYQSRDRRFGAR